jgi:hypothetical protein
MLLQGRCSRWLCSGKGADITSLQLGCSFAKHAVVSLAVAAHHPAPATPHYGAASVATVSALHRGGFGEVHKVMAAPFEMHYQCARLR